MARLNWNAVGERYFELGVDRGVLYIDSVGYAWSGLVSVAESISGGEAKPKYLDGFKYANVSAAEEFGATIQAFSSPAAFSACDGTGQIHNGLFATQQPRRPFDFSYRTLVGNDIQGSDHGYKIHLVYGALAAPSSRTSESLNGSVTTLQALSWSVTTQPPKMSGIRPTSHFLIDSRTAPADVLAELEDILYGTDTVSASIPTVAELIELFNVSA